ncbi:hypothetical protein TPHA_0G02530 [Tetrapisispora phaffii CBS 4417]|uniref:Glucose-6-phosphate 1-epimerase n=1 Tax=Tetrapisispora phaffii (strain ATCC 24235 / CBS 4417 / NBRC 1672 / NRRL Y-8282 / UCD 70-5) TaxID=1071381 RepID=G8BW10_TETPH|nr:hypothetical protein TPHA_0G02530 [Tetrapisispora phaffii CBS 4417]CCE64088.1 hypothetical protein TPHA_0G02530 [Tetrapisispora phaffii CBS 4417]
MASIKETSSIVTLTHPDNKETSVTILKYGATVYSWKREGVEQLWLSSAAKLDGSKPVRGGIPLVFPAFGKNTTDKYLKDLPQHGFARNSNWTFKGIVRSYPPTVQFELNEGNANRELIKAWPYKFTILYNIELGYDHLKTSVDIRNESDVPFDFNWLFHTYYNIQDSIENVYVHGLENQATHDNITGKAAVEKNAEVIIDREVDRRYLNVDVKENITILNKKTNQLVHGLIRENLSDAVVWNPWIKKSAGMGDFEPKDGYKNMLCVEPGHIHDLVTLRAKQKWSASQYMY